MDTDTTKELKPGERRLKHLMQFWTVLFGVGGFVFVFFGQWILMTGNRIGNLLGMSPMPLPVERFWLALTFSMMMTITAICYYIQKDVVQNKKLTSFIILSKFVSTTGFLFFFLWDGPYFNYLLGSLFCDGPIFLITLFVYRKALCDGGCPGCPKSVNDSPASL